jgi:hypothetical protein
MTFRHLFLEYTFFRLNRIPDYMVNTNFAIFQFHKNNGKLKTKQASIEGGTFQCYCTEE